MKQWLRVSVLIGLVMALFASVGTSSAAWTKFGGSIGDGRVWAYQIYSVCLDGVRVGFATNRYYDLDDDSNPDVEDEVWAMVSWYEGFNFEEDNLLQAHQVMPGLQKSPVLTSDDTPLDYHTIVNIPWKVPFTEPTDLNQYSATVFGTSSGGSDMPDVTMGNCYLFDSGLSNGDFEVRSEEANKFPADWKAKRMNKGDKLKCDKFLMPAAEDKFKAYEGSCAFQFKGKGGDKPKLVQKLDITNWESGDGLFFETAVFAKNFGGDNNLKLLLKIIYADGTKAKVNALADGDPTTGYARYFGATTLDGPVQKAKVIIGFKPNTGKMRVDGTYLMLNKSGAVAMPAGWLPLPDAP